MPLTNAEKQKAHRRRMAEKMARYEAALRDIASYPMTAVKMAHTAYTALNPTP